MIIDAHQHIWDLDRAEYPWLGPGMGELHRTVEFPELAPTLRESGIEGTVLVQAADNAEDTGLMLDVAARYPEIVAVVAWAPLDRPDLLPAHLEALRRSPIVAGIRVLIHEREPGWLAQAEVDRGLAELVRADLPFDFVTAGPAALAELPGIGSRHPDLRIVIDHLGKPPIGRGQAERAEWRGLLAEAAANPLTCAKVSGLYSSAGDLGEWTVDGVRPFVEDALDLFGADRLMYGGDWPISVLAGGYERTWTAVTEILAGLSPSERTAILGGTAARFYRIPAVVMAGGDA
jgi:L-fuconolactonase